jgi:fatty acid desaturase
MALNHSLAELAQRRHFSLPQARTIVQDEFAPRAWIYWTDFLLSLCVGLGSYALVRKQEFLSWQQGALFVVSVLGIYRAVNFIHELIHLRTGTFRAFRFVWNLLCGIPMLVPSFMYYTHLDHHRRNHYGTDLDGEYVPLGSQSRRAIVLYLLQPLIIPVLAYARFMLLTPLAWLSPAVRRWAYEHASSMVMDPKYIRPYPTKQTLWVWRLQEGLCCFWTWAAVIFAIRGLQPDVDPAAFNRPILNGVLPLSFFVQMYLTGVAVLTLNMVRTLGAHRFLNDGGELTFAEQLLDSVNYDRWGMTGELWAPVGLRFHALHHLFPSLPYHNLARAHRKLMAELPADSLYRESNASSLWSVLSGLWQAAKAAEESRKPQPTRQSKAA